MSLQKIFLIGLVVFCSCTKVTYTSEKYFNCSHTNEFNASTENQKLLFEILKRSVVDLKNIPDYDLIKDKKNIYVNKMCFPNSFAFNEDLKVNQIEIHEIPGKIADVNFCLKSKEELQKIANISTPFIYLTIGNISIQEDIATIGISTNWQSKTNSQIVYSSGGGYILQYKKIDGKWIFDEELSSWIS